MANQITGKILIISPIQQIPSKDGTKSFTKRELILDATRIDPYTGQRMYENYPTFEFAGDKCSELDRYQPGMIVTVSFDLQGTRYTDKDDGQIKYFNRIRGYRIEERKPVGVTPQPAQSYQQPPAQNYQQPPVQNYQQQPYQPSNYPPPDYPAPNEPMPF